MCMSCGCGDISNVQGDNRNITVQDLDQAAQAAGTTRDRVIQNIVQSGQSASASSSQSGQAKSGDYYQSQPSEKQSGLQPEEVSPELGQASGTAWQESQQRGEAQNPQTNL